MARRFLLVVVAAFASMAFVGIGSATAADYVYQPCQQHGNPTEVFDFTMSTPDSHAQYAASGVNGSGYICGTKVTTNLFSCDGVDTLYKYGYVDIPHGVEVTNTDTVPEDSFAGSSDVVTMQIYPGCSSFVPPIISDPADYSTQRAEPNGTGDCPANSVACYYGYMQGTFGFKIAENYNWVVPDPQRPGELQMVIGPITAIGGIIDKIGLLDVQMHLCRNFGQPGQQFQQESCGTSQDTVVQKNGRESVKTGCVHGTGDDGLYTIIGEQRGGTLTSPADTCATWLENADFIRFPAPHGGNKGGKLRAARR